MNPARIILIVVALAIGGVTAFAVKFFIDKRDAEQAQKAGGVETVDVLVAARPLPAGTIITGEHIRYQPWPKTGVHRDYIVRSKVKAEGKDKKKSVKSFNGFAVVRGFNSGEPLIASKLVKPGTTSFLSAALRPGYRAVTLRIGVITGTGGFILPGSYVDIILTQTVRVRAGPTRKFTVAETLFRKVRVIAVDRVINDIKRAARKSRTATVEVKLKDAKKLIVARRLGSLTLMVRSAADDPEAERGPNLVDTNDVSVFRRGQVSSSSLVLVTTKVIKTGTLLTDQDFEWRLMAPGTNLDGLIQPFTILSNPLGYISDPFKTASSNFIRGALVKEDLKYGEPIRRKQIILPSSHGYITSVLKPGMRAVSIPINQITGIAGFLAPGDRVDVSLSRNWRDRTRQTSVRRRRFTEVLLTNVRLLAIDQLVNPLTGKPFVFGTVTLEVTPFDSQRITVAMRIGQLSLSVRTPGDQQPAPRYASDLNLDKASLDFIMLGTARDPDFRRHRDELVAKGAPLADLSNIGRTIRICRANRCSTSRIAE